MSDQHLQKWRLILGKDAAENVKVEVDGIADAAGIDTALEMLYDDGKRTGGLGASSPKVNRWLGDIRKYFPKTVVQMMQRDAIERLNLKELLLEPEMLQSIEPDIHLVGTILSLKDAMPNQTRDTARMVVRKLVEELQKKLQNPLRQAIEGALNRAERNPRPRLNEIDWHKTIRANLKNYQTSLKSIIPERVIGYGKKGQALKHIVLLIDQSGSMSSSVVYASICGAVMASLKSIKTSLIVFDTNVVDMTQHLSDPVELLFGVQLGGGTDINKAVAYGESLLVQPRDTIFLLISDLHEGGSEAELISRMATLKAKGVQCIVLLALSDEGSPSYDKQVASSLNDLEIPSFACTPDVFPELIAAAIKREDVSHFLERNNKVKK